MTAAPIATSDYPFGTGAALGYTEQRHQWEAGMPSIPEVQDVVRGINVSIVDLIGALLPGLVWFILLASVVSLARDPGQPISRQPAGATSPANPASQSPRRVQATPLQAITDVLQFGHNNGNVIYVAVVLVGILLGWVIKASGLDLADRICASPAWLLWRWLKRGRDENAPNATKDAKSSPYRVADFRFPYNRIVENEHPDALARAKEFATDSMGQLWEKAPRRQPFESCKLVLGQLDPICRDTAERAEAQVALLGSLFLAALFSFVLSLFPLLPLGRPWSWGWTLASGATAAFLGYSFHQDRRAEVDRIYLMALLVQHDRGKDLKHLAAAAAAQLSD